MIIYYDTHKTNVACKRVIGLPGDKVELQENVVYVNDVAVNQVLLSRDEFDHVPDDNGLGEQIALEALQGATYLVTFTPGAIEASTFGPVVVSPDEYFILGDHRDNSYDSRFIGSIARDQIKGRVIYGARSLAE